MNPIKPNEIGQEMYGLIAELFPICRSITGNGLRETLKIIQKHIPLEIHEIPSGTQVFDWTVPKEWNIRDAYVKNSKGEKIIDFQKSNLHVLNYSIPVKKIVSLKELKEHLFTLPDHPDWVPYKTSYYQENWGFCLSHNHFQKFEEGNYEVLIDSTLENGFLTYGELYLPGEQTEEIVFESHACHPSLCNDNLSGVSVLTFLAKYLSASVHRYSYRFLFIPGNIGTITWLNLNEEKISKIRHGLVITGVGDSGPIAYKKSKGGDAEIDQAAIHILKHSGKEHKILEFSPYGYGERQFCSPGFNLPFGRFSRTPPGEYAEYHTSADNLNFVHPEQLEESLERLLEILFVIENNKLYSSTNTKCEPNLGKRGLYKLFGREELAMLWVMNLSDGCHKLLDIAERSGMNFQDIFFAATKLFKQGLLKEEKATMRG
jgi:aminopeptidase-like protein